MKDLWGDDIPEEEPEVKVKKLGIFDFFTDITDSKVNLMKGLSEEHHDVYEPYKMNKFLSQSADSILYANDMNGLPHLPVVLQYEYFINSIRRRNRRPEKWLVDSFEFDNLKNIRKEMEDKLEIAYKSLIMAQAISGSSEVEIAASSIKGAGTIEFKPNNIMGVKVPKFKYEKSETKISEKGYSLFSTSLELDTAAKNFEAVLEIIVKLGEAEATIRRLAEEIKKTKRKVNALERILIPRLEEDIVYIRMRLEEMERENFSRLKVIKKRISE